jgi:hypothetical protein
MYSMGIMGTDSKVSESDLRKLAIQNRRLAKRFWAGRLSAANLDKLIHLTRTLGLSVSTGEILYIDGNWYVTHAGLLRIALRQRCLGIRTALQERQSDSAANRWVFRATVYKSRASRGFVGYGDADPSNVSPLVRGAEMRVAETRAVNRALRKAYGIGLCSVEELGWLPSAPSPSDNHERPSKSCASNSSNNGHPRLRDQLCLLIRKYELDPTLVKRYAADFCGTEALRDASRDLVEAFISTLADEAAKDRAGLICKLNSYNQLEEVKS